VALGGAPAAMGQVWHLPCPPPLSQRKYIDIIFAAAGHPPKLRSLPPFIFAVIATFVPVMKELKEMEYQWRIPFDFKSDKFKAAFPAVAPTSHEAALKETVAWFKANAAQ
jgi:hypothetical protein